ncbi:MAG: P1 family peptidase [Lachnospiraceae bacterium]
MKMQKRAADYGIQVGKLKKGARNKITDVAGVTVGHCTVDTENHKTGVTMIMPCEENTLHHNLPAAAFVLNGFGKTAGLVQIEELGTIESPIAMTNTLNVGKVHDAVVEYLCRKEESEGGKATTLNPIVTECNDSSLNDIRHRAVGEKEVFEAIEQASEDFLEGAVGAGTGMICHGLKGGIGSASRVMDVDGRDYTLGVLALANYGAMSDLTIAGENIGKELAKKLENTPVDKGSCIIVIATDLPLDTRQLGRVAKRASVGLARLGSFIGHGSGEVFIAFSTANAIDPSDKAMIRETKSFREGDMDLAFRAVAECAEEAILNVLFTAKTVTGYKGKKVYGLTDVL